MYRGDLAALDTTVKDLRVVILNPAQQVGGLLLLEQETKEMRALMFARAVSEWDPAQLLPRHIERLSSHKVAVQRRSKTGLVLSSFAVKKEWARCIYEELAELEQRFRVWKIGGAQMEIVIFDAERFEVDGAAGLVAAIGTAKVDRSANF
jgi:hypothetical protein